ncbi:hypothetical protein OS493_027375 [Desmophyllum pertusum]|uniref:C-type lectin domain-containing protein n=1 Tax=Desmophyllum pertusum TaxID=174260 RepID=A0A9W9Z102_9CNID|nr:hypothetical protein OS493_027375 [Desmophyllum pertusum]
MDDTHTCKCVTYSFHHHKRLTWITSREWCVKNIGDLVSMETREEWNYLKDFIQTLPGLPGLNTEYYIGLRKDRNGSWHWLSNNTKAVSAGPGGHGLIKNLMVTETALLCTKTTGGKAFLMTFAVTRVPQTQFI